MTEAKRKRRLLREPGVQMYLLLCVAALAAITLLHVSVLLPRPWGWLGVLVPLVGALALALRLPSGPILLLATYAFTEIVATYHERGGLRWTFRSGYPFGRWFFEAQELPRWFLDPIHLLLGFAFLAYALGHYRLLGLTQNIFPVDPRRRRQTRTRRPAALATVEELAAALITMPLCVAAAELCWYWLVGRWLLLGLPATFSRFLVLAWAVLAVTLVGAAALGWWRSQHQSPERAKMFLQDVVWRQTRGEQRRINRWLAWARLRKREP